MSRGLELALVPVMFGALGLLVDSWLDTRPLFVIAFAVFGVVGVFVKMWIGYDAEMRRQEAALFGRSPASPRPGSAR